MRPRPPCTRLQLALASLLLAATTQAATAAPSDTPPSADDTPAPVAALPTLSVPAYMGTWYQVAWFPNRFQKQCVSDTQARYRQLPDGSGVEVTNRCRLADGRIDEVIGLARPAGSRLADDRLEPAQLEVSFLPAWLRWLPIWGSYWVIQLADDGRYAVVSEPRREYLWVLSRTPTLALADETAIRSRLAAASFDLTRWQHHPHTAPAANPQPTPDQGAGPEPGDPARQPLSSKPAVPS